MNKIETEAVLNWLSDNDTASSSKCLINYLATNKVVGKDYPWDSDDLGRCIRALDILVFLKPKLAKAKQISKVWGYLIDNWTTLTNLYNDKKYSDIQNILDKAKKLDTREHIQLKGGFTMVIGK